jgi:hypothetical protein
MTKVMLDICMTEAETSEQHENTGEQKLDQEALRVAVYSSFARTGRSPDQLALSDLLRTDKATIVTGLRELAQSRHLVLENDVIVMAHPFAAIPLGFSVMGRTALWWGGCAWDSFAIPHLLPEQAPVLVATKCPNCGTPLAWNVSKDEPPIGLEVAHFLVPAASMWDDVVHTCRNQQIFCSESCVERWLERNEYERGYVMDLSTLWRLAAGWYTGRLTYGYVRREPSEAVEYLKAVGLNGEFWGL